LSFAFLNTNRQNELYEISNNFKTQHSFMYTCGYEGIKLRYGQVISITWVIRNVLTGLNDKRKSIIKEVHNGRGFNSYSYTRRITPKIIRISYVNIDTKHLPKLKACHSSIEIHHVLEVSSDKISTHCLNNPFLKYKVLKSNLLYTLISWK
jgi:hypothetical protein